jgi:acyl-CoA thioesterase I
VRRILLLLLGAVLAFSCGIVAMVDNRNASSASARNPTVAVQETPAASHQAASTAPAGRPLLVVVGASFTAGVGGGPTHAWPQDLAHMLNWRLVVSADPGAGYVNPGVGHKGPFARLAARVDIARLHPAVVIVQGGHNDIGAPLSLVGERVASLVDAIRRASPQSKVGVLTVFNTGSHPSQAAFATDRTIVAAARQADPQVMVFDPLAEHWQFPRVGDKLHPNPAGHQWIATHLAAALQPDNAVACATGHRSGYIGRKRPCRPQPQRD